MPHPNTDSRPAGTAHARRLCRLRPPPAGQRQHCSRGGSACALRGAALLHPQLTHGTAAPTGAHAHWLPGRRRGAVRACRRLPPAPPCPGAAREHPAGARPCGQCWAGTAGAHGAAALGCGCRKARDKPLRMAALQEPASFHSQDGGRGANDVSRHSRWRIRENPTNLAAPR